MTPLEWAALVTLSIWFFATLALVVGLALAVFLTAPEEGYYDD